MMKKRIHDVVFTPIETINVMLNKLYEHYNNLYGHSIFTSHKLKWFDPANELGDYSIVIYYKSINGLKKIKNKAIRKNTQDIRNNKLILIPLPTLNKVWNYDKVNEYFELD